MTDAKPLATRIRHMAGAEPFALGLIFGSGLGHLANAVFAISNMAAGPSDVAISHDHTKAMAPLGAAKLERLLARALTKR
ncbi:MAG: hypothetical protein AUK37_08535 [Rhodobacterales bacterium CG2_30_65_12]|nr:MAG: hypothetical protein AUK37_08535 [Rhodobacterales bacterium CG2_30_65_12]